MTRRERQVLMGDPLLNVREAAGMLGVCVDTVRFYYRTGKLPCVRLGYRTVRVRKLVVEKFIEERSRP